MTDSKVFSSDSTSIQGLSDLEIITGFHFERPELFEGYESREKCIAGWQKLAKTDPTKLAEVAETVRKVYIEEQLKPNGKQGDMSAEIISLFDDEPQHEDKNEYTITENFVLDHQRVAGEPLPPSPEPEEP
jgi:hypothetical protein